MIAENKVISGTFISVSLGTCSARSFTFLAAIYNLCDVKCHILNIFAEAIIDNDISKGINHITPM